MHDQTCSGTGTLICRCGGDNCICDNHGEIDCPGCLDCRPEDYEEHPEWYPRGYGDMTPY